MGVEGGRELMVYKSYWRKISIFDLYCLRAQDEYDLRGDKTYLDKKIPINGAQQS